MSGLRVGHERLLDAGMTLPGLRKRAQALAQLPPLGLLTIASLVDEHWDVELISDNGFEPFENTVERIVLTRPDIVAFSSLTPAVDRAIAISTQLRKLGIATAIGGLHATALPDYCRGHFDAVVAGDGEPVFPRLLQDYIEGKLGSLYSSQGTYDLRNAPMPRWDLWKSESTPRYTLQTLRGCPWSCSFCAASRLLGPVRAKPDDLIQSEIQEILKRQKRPWIELADDNSFAFDRDFTPMLDALHKSGARWFTESDWRIADKPELLKSIARSGCQQILVGVESSVFRYPGMGAKTASLARISEACQAIQESGIIVNACFIVGADGETEESIDRLGEYLEGAPFGEIQLTVQTPFPGTSLYKQLHESGRLLYSDFSKYTLFDIVYRPESLTVDKLERRFEELVLSVFDAPLERRRVEIRKAIRSRQRSMLATSTARGN